MGKPFVVNAADLLRRPGTERDFQSLVNPSELDLDDERFVPDRPVEISLHLESLSDSIVVRGEIGVSWRGVCRRCLVAVSDRTLAPIHELFQLVVTDPDAFAVVGDQLDLAGMVREHALLILPDGPLCRVDCAGLCAHCGADLNEARCDCAIEHIDDRWAALNALRSDRIGTDTAEEWLAGD
jgi:uncharacterized protein